MLIDSSEKTEEVAQKLDYLRPSAEIEVLSENDIVLESSEDDPYPFPTALAPKW